MHVTPRDWFWMAVILTRRREDSKGLVLVDTEQWLLIGCCFQGILLSTEIHSSSAGSGGQLQICIDRHFSSQRWKEKERLLLWTTFLSCGSSKHFNKLRFGDLVSLGGFQCLYFCAANDLGLRCGLHSPGRHKKSKLPQKRWGVICIPSQ